MQRITKAIISQYSQGQLDRTHLLGYVLAFPDRRTLRRGHLLLLGHRQPSRAHALHAPPPRQARSGRSAMLRGPTQRNEWMNAGGHKFEFIKNQLKCVMHVKLQWK